MNQKNKSVNLFKKQLIKNQIDLTKRHGIYCFEIHYKWIIENNEALNNKINFF